MTANVDTLRQLSTSMATAIRAARTEAREGDVFGAPLQPILRARIRQTGSMPPCVLDVLPPLPPELEYRFVWADLVLVDVHAGLIVDVLRDAAVPVDTIR